MSDEEMRTPSRKLWIIAVAAPVLYVLSYAPFFWAARFLGPTINTFCLLVFYAPLHWLADCLSLEDLLEWYGGLFL